MGRIKAHFEAKFVAGALAAIPVAVTVFIFWYVDSQLRSLLPALRWPFVGIAVALAAIYFLGVFVTSLLGRSLLQLADWVLARVPGLRDLYRPWKQMAVAPEADMGVFAKVVLIPDETGRLKMLGFTSGRPIEGSPDTLCVFVPMSPNPITGRLYFVPIADCRTLQLGAKEALKFIVSGGNYVPGAVGASLSGPRT